MLIEFRVKNFLSFKDWTVFSMVASSDRSLPENLIQTEGFGNRNLLRSAVIYGANAAGKSNLNNAVGFMEWMVRTSADRAIGKPFGGKPFLLDAESSKAPSEFEITFIHNGIRFQYGFSIDLLNNLIIREWLVAYPKGLPQKWFERNIIKGSDNANWYFGPQYKGEKERLVTLTRPDVLFLSIGAKFNHKQSMAVHEWFTKKVQHLNASDESPVIEQYSAGLSVKNKKVHEAIKTLLQHADLGISDFVVEEKSPGENDLPEDMPAELRSYFQKEKQFYVSMVHGYPTSSSSGVTFDMSDESFGTRRWFALTVPILRALTEGEILFIDELDASLHPILVRELIELFNDPKNNSRGAQLIFNTHDTTLLDCCLFRRDQIWFIEKDNQGASHLYPLLEFSPRKGEALAKGYLQGRYGAIPFIGEWNLDTINNDEFGDEKKQ
jgi:uncharacterized protein